MESPETLRKSQEVIQAGKQYILQTYSQQPIVLSGGKGSTVYDMEGNSYLDFVAGIAVNALGYGDSELKEALIAVIENGLTHCSNLYWNKPSVEAASLLSRLSGLHKTFFCNSGSEANEAALKLSRKFGTEKKGNTVNTIITMSQSFHGRTYGAVTVTGQQKYHKGFAPLMPEISYAQFNDLEHVESLITENTCAVIVEPIQGEGGIIPAEKHFLKGLRELCDSRNLLLIFDEVQCGMGRTGMPFAYQQYGVTPDILTLAKGLGAGLPIGAMSVGEKAAGILSPGDHASTFGGNLLASAAAAVVLRRLSNNEFLSSVNDSAVHLYQKLSDLKERHDCITDIRGMGLMMGIDLTCEASQVLSACRERGLLLAAAGSHTIRFVPPLIITKEEISEAMEILESVLRETVPA